jgi:hypothetical protein
LYDIGAGGILKKYTLLQLLSHAYPEHEWLPWKFSQTPKNYWEDVNNQRKFMEWASKELNIKDMTDWYKVAVRV